MERVIVTVKKYQETRVRDLDIPAGLEVEKLAEVIASALHWDTDSAGSPISYQIQAHPPGRVLSERETLVSAGIGDGAWLTFIPAGDPLKEKPTATNVYKSSSETQSSTNPVSGWRSLGIDDNDNNQAVQHKQSIGDPRKPDSGGYVWKEIDVEE